MNAARHVTLFHCPHTRSSGVLTLLEELGADYALHVMNMKAGENRKAAYLAINPMGKVPAPPSMSPYGDYDTTQKTITDQLARGDHLLGARFTAADVLWGSALSWTTQFGLVPLTPEINVYIDRVNARPAVLRAQAKDATLAAAQSDAAGKP